MKRLGGLLIKDSKLAYRNYYVLIVVAVAALLVVITHFVVPEEINTEGTLVYFVQDQHPEFQQLVGLFSQKPNSIQVSSRTELTEKMGEISNSVGVIMKEQNGKPAVEVVLQGYESQETLRALELSIKAGMNLTEFLAADTQVVRLRENAAVDVPFNLAMLPVMIVMEPVTLGFFLIAAMVFMEREEGTTRAYLVSPGRIVEYLGSKIIVMLLLGLISTVIITTLTVGMDVNWLQLAALVAVGSIFGSCVGLLLASYFNSLTKAMVWVLVLSIVLMLPQVSYFVPSFAPRYLTIMPTYGLQFAIKEALFPTGNAAVVRSSLLFTGIVALVLFLWCAISYRRNLARG